jgi:ribosomal protein S18 acetylase RimI-like enzyme
MAEVRSLGYRTDLIFPRYDGEIVDRGEYLVVRTPGNPDFFWGNFLLFRRPPAAGDDRRWRKLFSEEIGSIPPSRHETFGWDSPEGERGEVGGFLEAGFDLVTSRVLTAQRVVPPPRAAADVVVGALESDADWVQAVSLQTLGRPQGYDEAGYRTFRERQMARYRAMQADGRGHWFGAFIDGKLVANLGLFRQDELARFQSVETHPGFRRRGIAGTLIHRSCLAFLDEYPGVTLVIVAEDGSAAERLYRSIGFEPREYQVGLERWDRTA